MNLEDTNLVGFPAGAIQNHVFACHERIRALKAESQLYHAQFDQNKKVCDGLNTAVEYWKGEWNKQTAALDELKREALCPSPMAVALRSALENVRDYVTFVGGRDDSGNLQGFNEACDVMERILAESQELSTLTVIGRDQLRNLLAISLIHETPKPNESKLKTPLLTESPPKARRPGR